MTAKVDDLLPTAKELLEQIALAEAENAAESMRKRAEAEAEKSVCSTHSAGPFCISYTSISTTIAAWR